MTVIILYSSRGVIGMAHHLYFNGERAEVLALGAFFSALEVVPLTFLTLEAWSFLQLGIKQESKSSTPFTHKGAVMFLVAFRERDDYRRRTAPGSAEALSIVPIRLSFVFVLPISSAAMGLVSAINTYTSIPKPLASRP